MKPILQSSVAILGAAILGILTAGCSEKITSHYTTRTAATADIQKGWIPSVLPASATYIRETHNLDLNTGNGTFDFAAADAAIFKDRLTPLSAAQVAQDPHIPRKRLRSEGYAFYQYNDFYLAVNWQRREGEFWLHYPD